MNNFGNKLKKGSKQTAKAVAKQIRDESLEIVREGNRQITGESAQTEKQYQAKTKDNKQNEKEDPVSQEEIKKQQIAEDRYMKGLEAEVHRLQKLRQQEIEEQRQKEEQEKASKENAEKMVEIKPPGGENGVQKKMRGIQGKIKRKKSPDIGKMPSN